MDGLVVCHCQTFSTKWEEVSDYWAMLRVPFSLRNTAFCCDDFGKLTPQRVTGDGRNMSKLGDIERVDIGLIDCDVEWNGCQVDPREELEERI